MEILELVRALRRRWRLVGIGAFSALALGAVLLGGKSSSGVASTRVALDTAPSQLVETVPFGADSLPTRASLLAHLVASEPIKQRLARHLRIPPNELAVVDPALSEPDVPASLPTAAAKAAVPAASYTLTVGVENESLPIISIDAEAPDRGRAQALAVAAVQALKAETPPPGKVTNVSRAEAESEAVQVVPHGLQGFVVEELRAITPKTVVHGRATATAVAVSSCVFVLWCVCLALSGRVASLRRRVRSDRGGSAQEGGVRRPGRAGSRNPLGFEP